MFMQIIQAKVRDSDAVRAAMDRWHRELEPDSIGWLGGTYGITDDDTFVAAVRFESEEAAHRNSERPEQARWWQELNRALSGGVTFHDCRDVTLLLGGGSDEAGFVQIMQGHVRDRERARELAEGSTDLMTKYRPDIMGATIAIDENGFFTETVAFTSEAAAREAEAKEMPPEASRIVEEEMSLLDDLTYLDLHHPWFATHPR
jgi:hypothetical protein